MVVAIATIFRLYPINGDSRYLLNTIHHFIPSTLDENVCSVGQERPNKPQACGSPPSPLET